jgi:hypothetical protein
MNTKRYDELVPQLMLAIRAEEDAMADYQRAVTKDSECALRVAMKSRKRIEAEIVKARGEGSPDPMAGATLRAQVAKALGWTEEQTKTVSALALRDLVQSVSPKLADRLTDEIRSGRYIRQTD